jgi:tetratricopeptide (TPR) repeat protein
MDVFTNSILVYVAQENFSKAISKCEEQLEIVQDVSSLSAMIHHLKGGIYLAEKRTAEAERSLQKAIETNPNYLRPYYTLARIYLNSSDTERAIQQYLAVLEKDPNQISSHMLLGTIYDMEKKHELSEKHYRAALQINGKFAPAANNLAYLLSSQDRDLTEAMGLAQTAREQLPEDPSVMDTLGWIYYKKGLYDTAIGEFIDSLEKIPENATVHYHLGMAYYKKGEKDKARVQLEKALSLGDDFDGVEEARKVLEEL